MNVKNTLLISRKLLILAVMAGALFFLVKMPAANAVSANFGCPNGYPIDCGNGYCCDSNHPTCCGQKCCSPGRVCSGGDCRCPGNSLDCAGRACCPSGYPYYCFSSGKCAATAEQISRGCDGPFVSCS
jgi:hypothetical protein